MYLFKQTIFPVETHAQGRIWKTTDLGQGQHINTDFSLQVVGRMCVFFLRMLLVTCKNDFMTRKELRIKNKPPKFLISLYTEKELSRFSNKPTVRLHN